MSAQPCRRKCLSCRRVFSADYRNGYHQRYCSQPACRQASKKASQRRWRRKPENRAYDCGAHRVEQVQAWRQEHPHYWKRKPKPIPDPQGVENQPVNPGQSSRNAETSEKVALRDLCWEQSPALVGLIALVTGSTLREDIAATTRALLLTRLSILSL